MPGITQNHNLPANAGDFERLCRALFARHWGIPDAQLYGGSGHRQKGVDFYGLDAKGLVHGVQCKLHEPPHVLTEKEVLAEIAKAKEFRPKLSTYSFATTSKRDANLQTLAAEITLKHQKEGLFDVTIYSWDDIEVLLQEHPEVVKAYYGINASASQKSPDQILASNKPAAHPDAVEVLIVTAADGEDDAVRLVEDGGIGVWRETLGPEGYGFMVWRRAFQTSGGHPLRIALARACQMGAEAAGYTAARLVEAYKAQCLAMCGVCAGNPLRTRLGDVIIADRVWRYDEGVQENPIPGRKPKFRANIMTYPFKAQWTQLGQRFSVPQDAPWLRNRPRPRELQANWVLYELLAGRKPQNSPDRATMCADWTEVLSDLERIRLITFKAGQANLTATGKEHIETILLKYAGQIPEQPTWRIHTGPLGTGNNLVKDVDIWDRLEETEKNILGLDMEASVIGLTAHIHNIPLIVVKGVMDYAEPGRTQGFRTFAARAAAEVLISFLRKNLQTPSSNETLGLPTVTVSGDHVSGIQIEHEEHMIRLRFIGRSKDDFELRIITG